MAKLTARQQNAQDKKAAKLAAKAARQNGATQTNNPIDPNDAALNAFWGKEATGAGDALINKLGLGGEYLGRVDENIPGNQEYLDKLKAGLGGYTSQEYQAQREQMNRGINSQYATATGQLAKAQARAKVYGAAGAAQQANLIRSTQENKDRLEQDLYIKNVDEMQSRLNNYGKANFDSQGAILERQKTNMGNKATELASRVEAITGSGALALTKAQNDLIARIQEKGLKAIG